MVVECKKCGTRFQLDSERIPDDGIRVRCSRCKNAFHLQNPSQSRADAIEAVVEEAVADEGLSAPAPTEDLPIESSSEAEGIGLRTADTDEYGGFDDFDGEEDWEFNEEPPEYEEDPEEDPGQIPPAEDWVGGDLDQDSGEIGSIDLDHNRSFLADSGSGYAVEDGMGEGPEIDSQSVDLGADDLAGSNLSIEMSSSADPIALAEDPQPAQSVGEAREESFGTGDDLSTLIRPDELPPVAKPIASQGEVSEDPEDWDFFGQGEALGAAEVSVASGRVAGAVADTVTPNTDVSSKEIEEPGDWKGLEDNPGVTGVAWIASALAWIAFLGLLATGVILGVAGSMDHRVSAPAFVDVGEMRAANIRGRFLDTAHAGTLFLVTGDLVNPGNATRALHHGVFVSLHGENGRELDSPPAAAGSEIPPNQLREMPLSTLQRNRQAAARSLAIEEIGPGQSVRFTAAFVGLPEEASHFRIQALESATTAQTASVD